MPSSFNILLDTPPISILLLLFQLETGFSCTKDESSMPIKDSLESFLRKTKIPGSYFAKLRSHIQLAIQDGASTFYMIFCFLFYNILFYFFSQWMDWKCCCWFKGKHRKSNFLNAWRRHGRCFRREDNAI